MGRDIGQRRSSYFSGCMSPSCVPVHEEYTRIHIGHADKVQRSRRLRKLLRDIVNDSKISIYRPAKPAKFQYDAVSYSQNFDDGGDEYGHYVQMIHNVRCRQVMIAPISSNPL
ncbi:hypothetical protein F511_13368 [Dorcoceras hygrometricum]|uniref:Uncharacterized protein n=1 Tax=Dorcoceras hygrometricum TaxID=472368 RepID=A0A2Z7C706_9LAMI|nr:hypothetical protein F511_13368 [Dorcoceras hygrometricum]